jgi:predicted nuclease of predicted toxin-antitoxin system
MSRKFYKHKLLLDEHISPRQFFTRLNAHFDVKHIDHDLHHAGMADPGVFELAVSQARIILTKNVKDFRPLLREDSPGVISIPETWSNERVDTKLTALLIKHGANYFRGRYRSLAALETETSATKSN